MPDAGASRKRQIQVTPGRFNDATASGASRVPIARSFTRLLCRISWQDFAISNAVQSARRVKPGLYKARFGRFPPSLALRRLGFCLGFCIGRAAPFRVSSLDSISPDAPGWFPPHEMHFFAENKGFLAISRGPCGSTGKQRRR
jgi:hypothetical protein